MPSIRTLVAWYSALAVGLFAWLYYPLLGSNQQLKYDDVFAVFEESSLPLDKKTFDNKHIVSVVTGSTNGLGREIAAQLYALGLTVIIAGRNEDKCNKVIREILQDYPASRGVMRVGLVDTGDLESVSQFAHRFTSTYKSLHLLVLNAGIHYVSLEINGRPATDPSVPAVSPQGFDLAFSTNYLGHFLLAKMLLPTMLSSGKGARILNVASTYHMQADGTMLLPSGEGAPLAARGDVNTAAHRQSSYSNNKLAQVLHAKELQRRVLKADPNSGLVVASFCPGWVDTGILPNDPGGRLVGALAFNAKAGIIGAIGALFSRRLVGGEYASNFHNVFTAQPWSPDLFRILTTSGTRHLVSHILAGVVLLTQGATYKFTLSASSPESNNETLAAALFDWSTAAVAPFAG